MQLLQLVPTAVRRSALVLALGALAALLVSPAACAAGPRPLFQMPVPCGQTWDASTYKHHWPDDRTASISHCATTTRDNLSEGEPARRCRGHRVAQTSTSTAGGEHFVFLDHGSGWRTYYLHLESVPPLSVGQQIAQGEQIGRMCDSGADTMHLHYTQMRRRRRRADRFNGTLIDTHADNEDSYGTCGTDDAEALTSLNCPGDSFMASTRTGSATSSSTSLAPARRKIVRLDADGTGVTTTFEDTWSPGYTHLIPFYLAGGQQHAFVYKSSSGTVRFLRMNSQGERQDQSGDVELVGGWTHFAPFSIGGHPYFIAYDSLNGYANIERINPEGSGSTTIAGDTWTKGWTQIVPFTSTRSQYLFLYKGGSGEVKIIRSPAAATT